MLLTNQFPWLFRQCLYPIQLALYDDPDLANPFEDILRRRAIDGVWDKVQTLIPVGRLPDRDEAEPIPLLNLTQGYDAYGAIKIEATGKISMSKHMKLWARKFSGAGGQSPETSFAGHLADAGAKAILHRATLKEHEFFAMIFNYGGIPAGHAFFDQNARAENSPDVPASNFIYDGVPLFSFANAPHLAWATGSAVGPNGRPTGIAGAASVCGPVGTAGAAIVDTGGYFNAFTLPPSYWALKRMLTHFETNMAHDEQDIEYPQTPNALLVSQFNEAHWREVLNSRFVAYTAANTENVFQEVNGRFKLQLIVSRLLLPNTWFVGKANSAGIERLYPKTEDDPWAFYREEANRSYFISFDKSWGFMIRNWRYWVGGSVSIDGVTPPNYGNYQNWEANPV